MPPSHLCCRALPVPGFTSRFLTLICSYSGILLSSFDSQTFLEPPVSWGSVSRQRTVYEMLEMNENGGFMAAHYRESSLNVALQSVPFHQSESQHRTQLSFCQVKKHTGQDEGRRIWPGPHPAGCPAPLAWLCCISCQQHSYRVITIP